jgi:hypothetical protein
MKKLRAQTITSHYFIVAMVMSLVLSIAFPTTNLAQTLAFGQVLVFNSTSAVTVPNGKVWKIESENNPSYQSSIYNPQRSGCNYSDRVDMFISINGKSSYTERFINSSANLGVNTSKSRFPIWLPAGATLNVDCS